VSLTQLQLALLSSHWCDLQVTETEGLLFRANQNNGIIWEVVATINMWEKVASLTVQVGNGLCNFPIKLKSHRCQLELAATTRCVTGTVDVLCDFL
jgi:hypothetical protein